MIRGMLLLALMLSACGEEQLQPVGGITNPEPAPVAAEEDLEVEEDAGPPPSCEDIGRYPDVDYSVCREEEADEDQSEEDEDDFEDREEDEDEDEDEDDEDDNDESEEESFTDSGASCKLN